MEGLLEPEEVEATVGSAEVRETFKASQVGTIAGCLRHRRHHPPRRERAPGARRHDRLDGRIGSLRRFKEDAREV